MQSIDACSHSFDRQHRDLTAWILQELSHESSAEESIRLLLEVVKKFTGAEAVAIRLHEGDDYPYFAWNGFPDDFVRMENHLCVHDAHGNVLRDPEGRPKIDGMCGNVICGKTDASYPFFTEAGSFWTNSTSDLLATTSEKDRQGHTRNVCNKVGYESVALVPLRQGSETFGLLQVNDRRRDLFNIDIVRSLEDTAAAVGIALERRRAETELQKTQAALRKYVVQLQRALAPDTVSVGDGYVTAATYLPSGSGKAVGGDFYDVFRAQTGRVGIVIGDLAGKGVGVAACATAARSTIRAFCYELSRPDEALTHANSVIYSLDIGFCRYVTALLIVFDPLTGELSYASAGHPPAVIRRASGAIDSLADVQQPLGIDSYFGYRCSSDRLEPGDKLVLYTDGITDARRNHERFEVERVIQVLETHGGRPVGEIASGLVAAAGEWAGGRLDDDAAILVIERLESGGQAR